MSHIRKDFIEEDFHGVWVVDPFRWLEDSDDPDTQKWIDVQKEHCEQFLAHAPERSNDRSRLNQLWDFPRYSLPKQMGERLFFLRNEGTQEQPVLCLQGFSQTETLFDPNLLREDGTIALSDFFPSSDGRFLALLLADGGSDWQQIRILDVDRQVERPDRINHCKFTKVAWTADGSGFYYSRFPDPNTVPPDQQSYHQKVFYHHLGTNQADDILIYERPDEKELGFDVEVTDDGRYLVMSVWHGTDPENRFYYKDLALDGPVIRLLDEADASYELITSRGEVFYFLTTHTAPKKKVVAVDISKPHPVHWQVIVVEADDAIETAAVSGDWLVLVKLHDGAHQLECMSIPGQETHPVLMPGFGSVTGIRGNRNGQGLYFEYQSFTHPPAVYHLEPDTGSWQPAWKIGLPFDPNAYLTERVFYASVDGTQIPMFISGLRGRTTSTPQPAILYGYGGFSINMTPFFHPMHLAWMEQGGVFASACLRGGAEYGEDWHRAGMLDRKQNVFDDFKTAARWLIQARITDPNSLAIMGGSNGGLLVAACMLQDPTLYGAVVCRVPVIDMLRYHRFTVGRYWTGEYGNAQENPEHFQFLYHYSPLHNVKSGEVYPPLMVLTADRDDRVVPAHTFKFAATMQDKALPGQIVMTRIETRAGHGAGKPTSKAVEEAADILAFLKLTIHQTTG
jgi:prolyl oligopeptidase